MNGYISEFRSDIYIMCQIQIQHQPEQEEEKNKKIPEGLA